MISEVFYLMFKPVCAFFQEEAWIGTIWGRRIWGLELPRVWETGYVSVRLEVFIIELMI